MKKTILTLAGAVLFAGLAAAQPKGSMAPGSGSGSAPGTGATAPDYEDAQMPNSHPGVGSGSTGRDGEEQRGSIGAGRMEPGGSGVHTTSGTTVPKLLP
jgi:hypothetical protein